MKLPNAFRQSLRELFLLVALAAVGTAWYLDHRSVRELHELMDFVDAVANVRSPGVGSVTTLERLESRGHAYKVQLTEIPQRESPGPTVYTTGN